MVKFGYDETCEMFENADENLIALSTKNVIDDRSVYAEAMRIPGSFIIEPPVRIPSMSPRLAETTISRRSGSPLANTKCDLPYNNLSIDNSKVDTSDLSVDIDQQDVSMCDESDGGQTETISTDETASTSRLDAWYAQLSCDKSRIRLLQAGVNDISRNVGLEKPQVSYTAHELDNDLFGARIATKQYGPSSKLEQVNSLQNSRNLAKPMRPPFSHQWTNQGMLVGNLGNSLLLIEHARIASITDIDRADNCLKERLKHTDIILSTRGVPSAILQSSLTANAIQDLELGVDMTSVWQLTSALFDAPERDSDAQEYTMYIERERKRAVSSWLRNTVMPLIAADEISVQSPAELIYTKLTGFQLAEACSTALKAGDFRLATILPLAGGDREVQHAMTAQIENWRSTRCTTFVDKFYRRIYTILSGTLTISDKSPKNEAPEDEYLIPELDWKRTFGLFLWYGTSAESTIGAALQEFERTKYISETNSSDNPGSDIEYHILKASESAQPDISALLDARKYPGSNFIQHFHLWLLSSWLFRNTIFSSLHLQQNQQRLAVTGMATELDQVVLALAELLQAAQRFDWAIFVVLHLTVDSTRESVIKIILARNIHRVTDDLSDLLTQTLLIPRIWLQEAKALSLRAACQSDAEALCLLDASLYNEVHSVLLKHIAPQSIISGRFDSAYEILCKLSTIPSIDGWQHGGAVYKMAMEIIRATNECTSSGDRHSPKHQSTQARRLMVAVSSLQPEAYEQAVAKTVLTAMLTDLYSSTAPNLRSPQIAEEMKSSRESSALRYRSMAYFRGQIS